jgi:hypothetical protein
MKGLAYATLTTHNGVSAYNCSMSATDTYNYSASGSIEGYHDEFIRLDGTTAQWVVDTVECTLNAMGDNPCSYEPLEDQYVSFAAEPVFATCPMNTVGASQPNIAATAITMSNYGSYPVRGTDGLICTCYGINTACDFDTHPSHKARGFMTVYYRMDFGSTRLVQTVVTYPGKWNGNTLPLHAGIGNTQVGQFVRVGDDITDPESPLNHDCGIGIDHTGLAWNEADILHCHEYGRYLWVVNTYQPDTIYSFWHRVKKDTRVSFGEIFVGGDCPCISTYYHSHLDGCQPCPVGHGCDGSSIIVPSGNLTPT